jgi:predicted metal-dependent hydrolase
MHTIIQKSPSALALRDLLAIGALNISKNARLAQAKKGIANYQAAAEEFHRRMDGVSSDLLSLVQRAVARLRDAVDREIAHRAQRKMDDEPTQFLETITDYLYDHRVTLRVVAE